MKNYELLDMIGDANEDYVRAADVDVVRPRSRWRALAACAACAALIAAVYPFSRAIESGQGAASDEAPPLADGAAPEASFAPAETVIQRPGLHPYTLVEGLGGGVQSLITGEGASEKSFVPYAPGGAESGPAADADRDEIGGGAAQGAPAAGAPAGKEDGGDLPAQEEAGDQYLGLLRGMFGTELVGEDQRYPEWYGGCWIDDDQAPPRLAVAILDGLRTPELEAQIRGWCGGTEEVVFSSAKYSHDQLTGLMDEIGRRFEEMDYRDYLSYGVNVMEGRVDMALSQEPGDELLAMLTELDPAGDAISIRVYLGAHIDLTCDPGGPGSARDTAGRAVPDGGGAPAEESPVPGGAQSVPEELPEGEEGAQDARCDLPPLE